MTFDRDATIQKTIGYYRQYKGKQAAGAIAVELAKESDAYVRSRCDSVEEQLVPRWRRDAMTADVIAAGNRAERADRYHATGRVDAVAPYAAMPRVSWPDGFDRAKAIEALQAADVSLFGQPSPVYKTLADASDSWLAGALSHLIMSAAMTANFAAVMRRCGYVDTGARGPTGSILWRREVPR